MPSKSKRAASRQAQLSQRRKRRAGHRGRRTAERRPPANTAVAAEAAGGVASPSAASAVADVQAPKAAMPAATSQRGPRRVAAAPRARTRAARDRAESYEPLPTYAYLGSELKRIGAMAVVMAVALAALTVALG